MSTTNTTNTLSIVPNAAKHFTLPTPEHKLQMTLNLAYTNALDLLLTDFDDLLEVHNVFGTHYIYVLGAGTGSFRAVRMHQASIRSTARAIEKNICKYIASTAVIQVNTLLGEQDGLEQHDYDIVVQRLQQYFKDAGFIGKVEQYVQEEQAYLKAVDGTATLDW